MVTSMGRKSKKEGIHIGEGNGNPLQYSCLGNPTDRGAWQATVHGAQRVRHDLATKPPPCIHIADSLATAETQHYKATILP